MHGIVFGDFPDFHDFDNLWQPCEMPYKAAFNHGLHCLLR